MQNLVAGRFGKAETVDAGFSVADIQRDGTDAMDYPIACIYARKPPEYGVYGTAERVMIQFADATDVANAQRKALAPLNPIRGEINGLVDGWRNHEKATRRAKAERYDRRVGDALVVALEGDVTGAEQLLEEIKQDVLYERIAAARLFYLLVAFCIGGLSMLVLMVFWRFWPQSDSAGQDLFSAAMTGAVGAFFSISLAIRGRTVLPDLERLANGLDAALRMIIGVIGGAVLMAFIAARVVELNIGRAAVMSTSPRHWLFVLIVGFIAGFSERFVPDLLGKATLVDGSPGPTTVAPAQRAAAGSQQAAAGQPAGATATTKPAEEESPAEDVAADGCTADTDLPDDQATSDADLPPASGGVAKPEAA